MAPTVADMKDNDVVGMTDGRKIHLLRQAEEPLDAFQRRAAEVTGSRFLFRVYGEPQGAAEDTSDVERQIRPATA